MFSGRRIKQARENRGLKASFVAKKAGISPWYLSMIENGKRSPALETLQAIAEAVGVDEAEFFLAHDVSDSLNEAEAAGDE